MDVVEIGLPALYAAGGLTLLTLQVLDYAEVAPFPRALAFFEVFLYGLPMIVGGPALLANEQFAVGTGVLAAGLWFTTHGFYTVARRELPQPMIRASFGPQQLLLQFDSRF